MKELLKLILVIAMIGFASMLTSCDNKKAASTEQQGKEYTSAYICPMHCEGSGSDVAGTCPVCGMDYVKNKDHDADGHDH